MRFIPVLITALAIFIFSDSAFAADAKFKTAWASYLKGDYEKAIDACRVISKNKILGEEGHYIMGLSFLNLKDFEESRKNFEFILDSYPNSAIKPDVLLGLADSYYVEERYESAEEYYKRLLGDFSDSGYAGAAYLRLGISQKKQGKWDAAEASLNKLLRDYPLSIEAKEAKGYFKEGYFTIQLGAFSKESNAEKFLETLKQKGRGAFIEKAYNGDRLIYRVRTGNFKTKEEAQGEAAKFKKEGFSVRICS